MDTPADSWTVEVHADTSSLRRELAEATRLGTGFASALSKAFVGLTLEGRAFGDVLRSLALSLSRMALQAAFKPLERALGNAIGQAVAGGVPFARGGVVSGGVPVPFASGGVIASPVAFPLAGGRIGIAGERGAEAIMPLARGPDGRLGVKAEGSSSVNVVFNVSTPDVEGFRRSETQLAAMLARTIGRGQRNL
jgi:phage-related minor tail protein